MKERFVSHITGDVFDFSGFEDRVFDGEVSFKIKGVEFNVDGTNRNRALTAKIQRSDRSYNLSRAC